MRRRELITLLGGAAAWPLVARAQQPALPVVGYLGGETFESSRDRIAGFYRGMADTGYVEGRNVAIEYRWAEYHYDRLPSLAAELVRRQVAVIAVMGSAPGALALKAATQTIPIVFMIGPDPIKLGLVASLNRPGGNLTGATTINVEVIAKRLELLHELMPAATSIAVLVNPTNSAATEPETRELQAAAHVLGLQLLVLNASTLREIEAAYASFASHRADAILVSGESFFTAYRDQIVMLAARYAVPAIYSGRSYVDAGGLISYGTDSLDGYRQVGVYSGRILKGEKPADLPVQQVTKIELVINLKTARALGLTVPLTLLARADEVIE
jgi:putative tryptophan/tyrosine transport system substrate-binding protein